jgi:RNA polymerase sigma factor FliA
MAEASVVSYSPAPGRLPAAPAALAGAAAAYGGQDAYGPVALDPQRERAVVEAHLALVKRIVRQLSSQANGAIDLNDMEQIGLMGLVEAARRYGDVDDKFAAFAAQRVRGAILDELRRQDWRPRTVRQDAHRLRDGVRVLRRRLGREPTSDELQKGLGLSAEELLEFEQAEAADAMASLDELIGNGVELGADGSNLEAAFVRRRSLEQALSRLDVREQRVVQLYYEFELSLKEIAAVLDLTEARVCQINKAALRKMKETLEVA